MKSGSAGRSDPLRPKSALQSYLRSIREFALLTASGETRLAIEGKSGVEEARRRLVQHNLRLVVKIARSYRSSAVSLDELIAEGNLGLIEASRRFDPDRNVRFISYAAWWVRKFMIAAMNRGVVHTTSPQPKNPDAGAGAAHRDSPPLPPTRSRILSFEEFMRDSGDREFLDARTACDAPGPEATLLEKQVEEALASILHKLPEVERQILQEHYGLAGATPRTLKEIGESLGCTRERVRQLELRALERARRLLDAGGRR